MRFEVPPKAFRFDGQTLHATNQAASSKPSDRRPRKLECCEEPWNGDDGNRRLARSRRGTLELGTEDTDELSGKLVE